MRNEFNVETEEMAIAHSSAELDIGQGAGGAQIFGYIFISTSFANDTRLLEHSRYIVNHIE